MILPYILLLKINIIRRYNNNNNNNKIMQGSVIIVLRSRKTKPYTLLAAATIDFVNQQRVELFEPTTISLSLWRLRDFLAMYISRLATRSKHESALFFGACEVENPLLQYKGGFSNNSIP